MFYQLLMNFDAGHGCIERRRAQIDKTGRTGTDQNDIAANGFPVDFTLQYLPRRNEACWIARAVVKPKRAVWVRRPRQTSDAHMIDAARGAEGRFAARIGRFYQITASPLGNPQRFGCE